MTEVETIAHLLSWLNAHGLSAGWVVLAIGAKMGGKGLVSAVKTLAGVLVDVRDLLHDLRVHLEESHYEKTK